jgi:hypothetical protein
MYLTECVERQRTGRVIFRGAAAGSLRPAVDPDVEFLDGRIGLWFTTISPLAIVVLSEGQNRNVREAAVRLASAIGSMAAVRVTAPVLFVLLLVGLPLLAVLDRLSVFILWWGPLVVVAWVATAICFYRAHRTIYGRYPELQDGLHVVLSPLAAIRAPLRLLKDVLRDHSPLASAAAVCTEPDLLMMLRRTYFDDERDRPEVEAILEERTLTDRFWDPPAEADARMALFCPRCRCTYAAGATHCADCAHVELRNLRTFVGSSH